MRPSQHPWQAGRQERHDPLAPGPLAPQRGLPAKALWMLMMMTTTLRLRPRLPQAWRRTQRGQLKVARGLVLLRARR